MANDMFSKKCDICDTQPAMLFFRTFNDNHIKEEGLCPQCALKRFSESSNSDMGIANNDIINTINEMRHILSDIVGHISKAPKKKSSITDISEPTFRKCRACGTTNTDINDSNVVGCSICYHEFANDIKLKIQKYQFNIKHRGQIPARYRIEHIKTMELEKLKLKLYSLLRTEDYEAAAKVHKRITKLESSQIYY